ncbi:hypothetical protein SAMN05421738_11096 [Algoriella xinjiangensis]|uniref:Dihaem cytochrome c n=1 Tax=Algoriella xinjiangensis TaxID=684065 RepID=A0A1I4Y3B1_9FLAO|nr:MULTISPECIES: hypothetical protein [Algoriella]MBO6213422.1 hypothetical protein [Algoriella sp.]SFN32527.1 hypothetical protein SAMN05421738_11096 [Algoriella xinjiangensis]VDH15309.1 Uncharacterised protein [Algoriella xinjiangensis]
MKKFIQYLMLTISLFMTVYQSAHILDHALNKEHKELKDKYSVAHDHNCTVCHFNSQFIENNSEIALFEWTKSFIQKDKTLYTTHVRQTVLLTHKSLRAPPYSI